MLPQRLNGGRFHLTTRRHRNILIACVATLVTSGALIGLIGVTRWRSARALETDTQTLLTQLRQQLIRSLHSRRGTLTLLRDTLNRRNDLTLPQLQAMGASAIAHTRHLIGTGVIHNGASPIWWAGPVNLSESERLHINRVIAQRAGLPGAWRVPSTFTTHGVKPLLIMVEPAGPSRIMKESLVGLFDLQPLLDDFFTAHLPQRAAVRLLEGDRTLFQSVGWNAHTPAHQRGVSKELATIDSVRWILQMQPGSTRVTQTLSWMTFLLMSLSILVGLSITLMIWLLAARTWILQRAVRRRTIALRRVSERLRHMAVTDELTGLYNRRFFLDRWRWECARAKRYARPLACLMIDVNGFKQVNDRLGHTTGDVVLKQIAKELTTLLRSSDIVARFGGDEFIVALPETSHAQAELVAGKLRQLEIPIPNGEAQGVSRIRLSVGLSLADPDQKNPQEIIQAADQSLYASRHALLQHPSPAHTR